MVKIGLRDGYLLDFGEKSKWVEEFWDWFEKMVRKSSKKKTLHGREGELIGKVERGWNFCPIIPF